MEKFLYEDLTYKIIGCAMEVHNCLGPGFLESVYEDALCYELKIAKMPFEKQIYLDVNYKNVTFEKRFKADIIVDGKILIELKAIKKSTENDEAQLLNYLKVTGLKIGLLFNFGGDKLEKIRRIF